MKILAFDTATHGWSVALADRDDMIAEITGVGAQTHARNLMMTIEKLFDTACCSIRSIDLIAVTRGPGSFTGLRIGMSTAKGLAMALEKPLVGVSSLDALASQAWSWPIPIWAALDARKQEVYTARYRWTEGELHSETEEKVLAPDQWVQEVSGLSLFIGDGALAYKEILRDRLGTNALFAPSQANRIHATTVAQLGLKRFLTKRADPLETFTPKYIRKSDAERTIENA